MMLRITSSAPSNAHNLPILVDYNLTQITPFLFVSAGETAREFQRVFSNGIGCVINVAYELPQIVFPPQSGIESVKYPIADLPNFPAVRYFDLIADRIANNVASNRRTLIYCHHGRSRSVTFILAYLIKYHHLSLSTAFAIVQEQRQLALPNIGFWTQLRLYDLYYQKKNSSKIFINFQNSLQKIADRIKRIFTHNPIINAFTIHTNRTIYRRPFMQILYPHQRIYF